MGWPCWARPGGSEWRPGAGAAAGRKVRVLGCLGRRRLPVSPAPAPRGRPQRRGGPTLSPSSSRPPDLAGRCRWVDRGPWSHPIAVQAAWVPTPSVLGCGPARSPFGPCVASALTAAPGFAHAPVSPRGEELGRPPGGVAVLSQGEAGGLGGDGCPWGSQLPACQVGPCQVWSPPGPRCPPQLSTYPHLCLSPPAHAVTAASPADLEPRGGASSRLAWCPRHTGRAVKQAGDPWPTVSLVTGITGEAPAWAAGVRGPALGSWG